MSFKLSEGGSDSLLAKLKTELDLGKLYIYDDSAAEPSSPNDAVPGGSVLLLVVSNNGTATGVTFAAPSSRIMQKNAGETWKGTVLANGTGLWYRFIPNGGTTGVSTSEFRLQGSVGVLNADLLVNSTSFVVATERTINYYTVGLPMNQ